MGTPIVVCGIDDSSTAHLVLEAALREADHRAGRVRAVLAYVPPEARSLWCYGPAPTIPVPHPEVFRESAERAAHAVVEPVLARPAPDLPVMPEVEVVVRAGLPAEVLLEEADQAAALVVGRRVRGATTRALIGSTSRECVLRARCPVTVVSSPGVDRTAPGSRSARKPPRHVDRPTGTACGTSGVKGVNSLVAHSTRRDSQVQPSSVPPRGPKVATGLFTGGREGEA